jgi:FtsP/CotA-like multicopper oxidase with cupredoxin domain
MAYNRRDFLKIGAITAAGSLPLITRAAAQMNPGPKAEPDGTADYTIRIGTGLVELAPDRIISTTTYNGQFPGPLIRLKEGKRVIVDIHNDTDTPEQLHWHGQIVPVDVDGASEEGTPFIAAHGMRRIAFIPKPTGFRFYHSHVVPQNDLSKGTYSGQAGPVYIEPKNELGNYDREVFRDMPQNFLSPATRIKELEDSGESAMKASLAKGMPHGFEIGYGLFSINGRMLGKGNPIRVKSGERVLFHVLNASATEIRSLALSGHDFEVVALDGNPVPTPVHVPVLWLGTAERMQARMVGTPAVQMGLHPLRQGRREGSGTR